MTASRFQLKASSLLATGSSLLAVIFISFLGIIGAGCGVYREYVRRGELLDSISIRIKRVEREQRNQKESLAQLRAECLTSIEKVANRIDEVDAEVIDLGERLDKIGRRVGAWRGELGSEPTAPPETAVFKPDTTISGIDADRLYNTAYLDFTKGDYQVAITGFRRFLRLFPSSEMADNAQYWIGECFYSLNQLDSAEVEFKKVINSYPDGNKVPDAIYKLGLIYQLQGKTASARRQFNEVINKYPKSPAAKLAEERLKSKP